MRQLNPSQLRDHLNQADPLPRLIDVREPWEYQRARLPNTELIPMHQIPAALSRLNPAEEIVVICHHGIRSRQVALFLEAHGFGNVINLQGGIDGWSKEVDPSIPLY